MSLPARHDGIAPRSYKSLGGRAVTAIAVLLFSAAALWAQAPAPNTSDTKPGDKACQPTGTNSASQSQAESQADKAGGEKKSAEASDDPCALKQDEPEGRQTNRIMGVVPNFGAVSANTQLPPLTTKGKFWLATEDSFDYSSFIWTGILSGQEFALKNYPEFGQGAAGYGRYYWHTFVDGVSGTYFTEAIIPWITHEDPRYYTMGHGALLLGHAHPAVVDAVCTQAARGTHAAVVVGQHLKVAPQLVEERLAPMQRGAAHAHDQKKRRSVGVAAAFVVELDVAGIDQRHRGDPTPTSAAPSAARRARTSRQRRMLAARKRGRARRGRGWRPG